MFASIRKYHSVISIDELKHRVDKGFVPLLNEHTGFLGFFLIESPGSQGRNVCTTVSLFDSLDAAIESNEKAKKFVKESLSELLPEPPEIISGEVILNILNARR